MRAGQVIEEAADATAAADAMQAVIDLGIDRDGKFLLHDAGPHYTY